MNCNIERKCSWDMLFTIVISKENNVIISDKISGTNLATMVHLRIFIVKYIRTANSSESRSDSWLPNAGSFFDPVNTSIQISSNPKPLRMGR